MSDADKPGPSLLLLFGPPAVGKTTVGQAIEQLTGFRLFHLHQIVDLVTTYFPYSESPESAYRRLVVSYRTRFFEEAARSGLAMGPARGRGDTARLRAAVPDLWRAGVPGRVDGVAGDTPCAQPNGEPSTPEAGRLVDG
jgi:hypothetical protein